MEEIMSTGKILSDHCQAQFGTSDGKQPTGTLGRNWLALCAEGNLGVSPHRFFMEHENRDLLKNLPI